MDLHGDFAGPELRSYLLIEHARNHQAHDLALACGQRLEALSQLGKLTLPLARHPVAIQSLVDRIQQVLVPEGLGQELHGTGFHGPHRHRNITMPGDEDDGNLDARISQLALKVQTVDSRKSHVENKATWPVRPLAAQELLRRPEGLGTQANRLQEALDRRTHSGIVIKDEHRWSASGRHSSASTAENIIAQ